TGAAGRAVVGFAGTEDEALAVRVGRGWGAEELDVIDEAAVRAGDALPLDALPDAPRVIGQGFQTVERERLSVIGGQEEPVAAPRNVAGHRADPGGINGNACRAAVTRHVANRDAVRVHETGLDHPADGLDAADSLTRPAEM